MMPKVSLALRALNAVLARTHGLIAATLTNLFTHDDFLSNAARLARAKARSDHRMRAAIMPLS
jgi:hypothetical protein